jgi:HEAT repeat protein
MHFAAPDFLLKVLVWLILALSGWMAVLLLTGAWIQVRRDRLARFRVSCFRRWEEEMVQYLYWQGAEGPAFTFLRRQERQLFIAFLVKVLGVLAGAESEKVQVLYHRFELGEGLARRLDSPFARVRGLAALEVGHFRIHAHYPALLRMLEDPVPHVAHAAARSLAATRALRFAEPVLGWMLNQDVFQRDRLVWLLESFGPGLLSWMEQRLDSDPRLQEFYAMLVGSFRSHPAMARTLALLRGGSLEAQAAALKALGSLGDPETYREALPFAEHENWILRAQAAKVLGHLGGDSAVPSLAALLRDPVFDVRRNAAYALSQLGQPGIQLLERVAADADEDPFARDLATERLQWAHVRGR